MENKNGNKVWFITGATGGLGTSLTKNLLNAGYYVASSSRDSKKLIAVHGNETESFLPLDLDPADEESLWKARNKILEKFGTIDVIVNNAGYALRGMIEEVSDLEVRKNFDINVFAVLNVIRVFGGILREKRSGCIINISSIAAFQTGAWSGIYGATKHAVEGISEALYQEMKPFSVNVITCKPEDMRTSFHDPKRLIAAEKMISDYKPMYEKTYKMIVGKNGHQTSDPDKIARKLIQISELSEPPLHFFVGSDSYRIAEAKIVEISKELSDWREWSLSVGCD